MNSLNLIPNENKSRDDQLARIKAKLRILQIDIAQSFNPPVSKAELEAFEQTHQIILPEDYKLFLTKIGNGGFGPYSDEGFLPLDQTVWPHLKPSLPFPYATGQKVPYSDDQTEEELKELRKFYRNAENNYGNILLSDYGCGIFAILIVT